MSKKKPDPKRAAKKPVSKKKKDDDLLARHGMGKAQQHGAEMNAAKEALDKMMEDAKNAPLSPPSESPYAADQILRRAIFNMRMRQITNIPKYDDDAGTKNKDAMDLIMRGPKTTASPLPGRGPKRDNLQGLTPEAGTKSLLKGVIRYIR